MPAQDLLTLGYNVAEFDKQTSHVIDGLNKVIATAEKVDSTIINLSNFSGGVKDFKQASEELNKSQTNLAKTTQDYNKALLDQAKVREVNAKATKAQIAAENEVIKQISLEEKAQQELLKTEKLKTQQKQANEKLSLSEAKQSAELTNDYMQLSRAYSAAALKAKNYALQLGEQHPVTVQAVKDAKSYYDILYKVDSAVGQYGRNVGNYKSAFNGLNVSVAQVARELPSLTISAQQFFLAISNNLPMVADEIAKAKAEVAALRAEGQQVPGVFSRVVSSLLSWQTLLAVGITLLTAYGKELIDWIGSLFKAKTAIEQVTDAQVAYNEALKENQQRYRDLKGLVAENSTAELNYLKQKIDLLKASGASEGAIFAAEQEYNTKRQSFLVQQITGLKDLQAIPKDLKFNIEFAQQGALTDIFTLTQQINGLNKTIVETTNESDKKNLENKKKLLDIELSERKTNYEHTEDLLRELNENELKIAEANSAKKKKITDAEFEYQKNALERQIKELQDFVNNGSVLFDERNTTAQQLAKTQIALTDLVKDHEIKNGQARVVAEQEAAYKIEDIATELMGNLDKIFKESKLNLFPDGEIIKPADVDRMTIPILNGFKMINDAILKNLKDTATQGANLFGTAFQQELFVLSEKYNQGLISRQKYEKGVADLTKKYSKESLKYAIDEAEKRLALLDKETDAYKELAKAIAAAKAAANKGTGLDLQELADNVARLSEAFSTISNIKFDNQKADLEEISAQEEKRYEQERQNIEQSAASNEEKAQQQILLDAKHAAQQEEYARRQREVDNKKAEFDKAVGIMNIIIGTAASVAKATTIFEKIAFAAIGAAQLAAAIATQVPHYADGLFNDKAAHYGVYGEAGAELVKKPGKPAYVADTATLDFIPYGTRIIPLSTDEIDDNLHRGMMRNTARAIAMKQKADAPLIDIKALGKEITNSLKHQKRPYVKVINNIGNDLAKQDYIRRNLL